MIPFLRQMTLAAALFAGPSFGFAQPLGTVTLTPEEMQATAVVSLQSGQPERALALSEALLLRDEQDPIALQVAARAALEIGRSDIALERAQTLYRTTNDRDQRFVAARIAALVQAQDGRFTASQIWLRRARQLAPSEAAASEVAEDYRIVRMRNPWAFQFGFGVSPSSNINGGSSQDNFELNLFGNKIALPFSARDRAQEGYEASASAQATYVLRQNENSFTQLIGAVATERHFLTAESRENAPDFDASALDMWRVLAGVNHTWRAGSNGEPAAVSVRYDRTFYDNALYSNNVQLGVMRQWNVGDAAVLTGSVNLGQTRYVQTDEQAHIWSGGLSWRTALENGDILTLNVDGGRSNSDTFRLHYEFQSVGVSYDFNEVGPYFDVALSADYDWKTYGSGANDIPDREDATARVAVTVGLPSAEIYGFTPVVTYEAARTESTSVRYQTETTSLDVSFRSSF